VEENLINVGGLAREHGGEDQVALIGFGTYQGEVIASKAWGGPTQILKVPPARSDSYETYFHRAAQSLGENSIFLWMQDGLKHSALSETWGQRAIGVVYDPRFERTG